MCALVFCQVENFTVSFSDGRALCYLIHHYHPSHLPLDSVRQDTTQTVEYSGQGRVELNCSSSDSDSSFDTGPTAQNGTFVAQGFPYMHSGRGAALGPLSKKKHFYLFFRNI